MKYIIYKHKIRHAVVNQIGGIPLTTLMIETLNERLAKDNYYKTLINKETISIEIDDKTKKTEIEQKKTKIKELTSKISLLERNQNRSIDDETNMANYKKEREELNKEIKKIQQEDSKKEIPKEIYNGDPTNNKKYLYWIIDSYNKGCINSVEDVLSRVNPALQNFIILSENVNVKNKYNFDIMQYCGLTGKDDKIGIETFLEKDEFKEILKQKEESIVKEGVDYKIFDKDDKGNMIIIPLTEKGSQKYGSDTRWCTSADKNCMFEHYNKEGELYIIILRDAIMINGLGQNKFQLHERHWMDSKDQEIGIPEIEGISRNYVNVLKIPLISQQIDKRGGITDINILKSMSNINEYYHSITRLYFGDTFNQEINIDVLPNSLENLIFGKEFNQEIMANVLPSSLTFLIFGDNFNKEIKTNVLPSSLTYLIFGKEFNQEINIDVLPSKLTALKFGKMFNREININVLPSSLTHLIFGDHFNQELNNNVLPSSLKELIFGKCFNKEININVLPSSLTHLTFGKCFNKEININVLPPSLTHLTFGKCFNKEINTNVLPSSLLELTVGKYFNQEIKANVLPSSLTHLFGNRSMYNKTRQLKKDRPDIKIDYNE